MLSFFWVAVSWVRNLSWQQVAAIAAAAAGIFLYRKGRSDQRQKQKIEGMEEYADVRERTGKAIAQGAREAGAMSDDELNKRLRKSGDLRE